MLQASVTKVTNRRYRSFWKALVLMCNHNSPLYSKVGIGKKALIFRN